MPPESQLWLGGAGAPPCFLRGTRIRTASGEVPVEDIVPGEVVITLGGGRRRVAWTGVRRLDLARHANPPAAWPVRIRRGAIANGVPARDLLVSPDHAMLLNRMLIPAHALVNGATVLRDSAWRRLEYYHIALDAHDVLLAEGAAAESFPDRGSRATFGAERVLVLHPQFADATAAPGDCAPRASRGPAVQDARRALLTRARVLGHALTREADLHLLIDGARVNAIGVTGAVHRFVVPAPAADIRIVSRAGIPAESDPDSEDQRRLGVMLSRIVLHTGGTKREVDVADPALREGFHPPERGADGMRRWTDGHAFLPVPTEGLTRIDLHVLGTQPAWARAALPAAPMHRSA